MTRYRALSAHFLSRFGCRIQKIPLDIAPGQGMGCPNRRPAGGAGEGPGHNSSGCIFCNAHGSGTGLAAQGLSIPEQWDFWRGRYAESRKSTGGFIAYLQSYSNTYGTAENLAATLTGLVGLPGLVGLSIGTRPDCLDAEKIRILAEFSLPEKWVELGVQSSHDATLARIRRGHDAACSAQAIRACAAAGLQVCVHLIFGLPGEGRDDMMATVDWVNSLPVAGVKLHNLFVAEGTELERMWRAGEYQPIAESDYLELVLETVARLRPDIVIHRLVADTMNERLAAPAWAAMHYRMMQRINSLLVQRDIWQGGALTRG